MDGHDLPLGGYVAGVLDAAERDGIEAHLTGCATCRHELAELREVSRMLAGLPPEALAQQPPDADLVLQRTLRQVRAESAAAGRRRVLAAALAAAAVLAVGVGAGVVLAPGDPPGTAAAAPTASGTRVGTIEEDGVRLTASVVPAAGWVRVNASVNGIPAGQDCRLYVVARDGRRELAGGWVVSAAGERDGVNLDGSAAVPPADVTAVQVANTAGRVFATLPL